MFCKIMGMGKAGLLICFFVASFDSSVTAHNEHVIDPVHHIIELALDNPKVTLTVAAAIVVSYCVFKSIKGSKRRTQPTVLIRVKS